MAAFSMKVVSMIPLYYGREYLWYALRSVVDFVEEVFVLYTPQFSYGHSSEVPCPESQQELWELANDAVGNKLRWHCPERPYSNEGEHRNTIFQLTDADMIVCVDSDEVWSPDSLEMVLPAAWDGQAQNNRVNFLHFWKSFNWVCRDACMANRVLLPAAPRGTEKYHQMPTPIYHFGYAQSNEICRFKWRGHGHQAEMRPHWFEEKYEHWTPGIMDVHPTCERGFWDPEPYDKIQLPELLKQHPYYALDLIE